MTAKENKDNGESTFSLQWKIIQFLSEAKAGTTARELAENFACSERTVKRHLATFRDLGLPLEEITEQQKQGLKSYRILSGVTFNVLQPRKKRRSGRKSAMNTKSKSNRFQKLKRRQRKN